MNARWIAIPAALFVVCAWLLPALLKGGLGSVPPGALALSILPGVLLPLMFPRAASNVRNSLGRAGRQTGIDTVRVDTFADGWCLHPDVVELRRKNARLVQELSDLRAAYAELTLEMADRSEAAQRLSFLAYHDALTQLPNRALLMDRLTQALAYAQRAGSGVLVVYVDLDRFKQINDSRGHAAGDAVLTEFAKRIAGCMRECDTASRVGGDEFVLVFSTTDGARDSARIEARLRKAIAPPIDIGGTPLTIEASIGMSLFPRDGSDPQALIEQADKAMYSSKFEHRVTV